MGLVIKVIITVVAGIAVPLLLTVIMCSAVSAIVKETRKCSAVQFLLFVVIIVGGIVLWAKFFGLLAILYGILSLPVGFLAYGTCAY